MPKETNRLHLPEYTHFVESIEVLDLEISPSELHGMMCGYLCAGEDNQGEAYIGTLFRNKKDTVSREAVLAIARIFSISQQQINAFDFEFQLLLPDDSYSLLERAEAFSQWCQGFTDGLRLAGIDEYQFYEEEAQEALQHLTEFSELDYENLDVDEEDEQALTEVYEYARMAVMRLHSDLMLNKREQGDAEITH